MRSYKNIGNLERIKLMLYIRANNITYESAHRMSKRYGISIPAVYALINDAKGKNDGPREPKHFE